MTQEDVNRAAKSLVQDYLDRGGIIPPRVTGEFLHVVNGQVIEVIPADRVTVVVRDDQIVRYEITPVKDA